MPETTFEIIVIGNEVLAGNVLDTNSYWLCGQLSAFGGHVARIQTVQDVPADIADAVRTALARGPALIVTCGGLGPTVDDLTAGAIAGALGRPLHEDAAAWAMVRDTYAALFAAGLVSTAEMTPARAKMALFPQGAQPLANSVGAAPGILLAEGETLLAALPGVPAEMKAIFRESLWPRIAAQLGSKAYAERTIPTDSHDESLMAPAVNAVTARHPGVYVKSRAQAYGSGLADFVTLAAAARDEAEVAAAVGRGRVRSAQGIGSGRDQGGAGIAQMSVK